MDPSINTKQYSISHNSFATLLLHQYSHTVVNFNNIIVPPPPPISNGKDPTAAIHKSISLTLAILTMFLQLKYQEPGLENPFKSHPYTMAVALWATLVYFVAGSGQISSPPASVPRHCIVWSGNAVVASLASLFAPDLIRPFLYGAVVLLSGRESIHLLWPTPESVKIV
ncbi:hypothetical protein ACS0TY_023299 [Phlomoides rotata]